MKKTINLKGKIIDVHTHCGGVDSSRLWHKRYPYSQNILDLDRKRANSGIDYSVIFTMPNTLYYDTNHYWTTGEFRPSGYCDFPFQYENEIMLKEVKAFELKHLLPFASVSVRDKVNEQINSIEKLSESNNIYGLKFHTVADQSNLYDLENAGFVELARKLNIPITAHCDVGGYADGSILLEVAARNTDVRFCAAHFAGFGKVFWNELINYPYDNVFVDTAPASVLCKFRENSIDERLMNFDFSNPEKVFKSYLQEFPNQMLFGTDEPWTVVSNLDGKKHISPEMFGIKKEVQIFKNCNHIQETSQATYNFLFGKSEE